MKSTKGKILIFDSCAGGFGVMNSMLSWAGDYEIIFIADYEMNPFGVRPKSEISDIVISWFDNYISSLEYEDVKLVVIACNTASIASKEVVEKLQEKYKIPIVTTIDSLKLSLQHNIEDIKGRNVGIFGTKYTIESGLYAKIVEQYNPTNIYNIIGTKSESSVAKGFCKEEEGKKVIAEELKPYEKSQISTLILGCTCFELIQDTINEQFAQNITFINPGHFVSERAKHILRITEDIQTDVKNIKIISTKLDDISKKGIQTSSNDYFKCDLDVSEIKVLRTIGGNLNENL